MRYFFKFLLYISSYVHIVQPALRISVFTVCKTVLILEILEFLIDIILKNRSFFFFFVTTDFLCVYFHLLKIIPIFFFKLCIYDCVKFDPFCPLSLWIRNGKMTMITRAFPLDWIPVVQESTRGKILITGDILHAIRCVRS